MSEFLKPETCKKIYNLLSKNPGLPLTKIAEMLDMRITLTEHYLISMEESGEIFSLQKEGYNRYYIRIRGKGTRDIRTQKIRANISDLISKNPGLHLSKIAEKLNMSAQLAEYHLLYMEKNNIIIGVKEKGGYYRRFYIKGSDIGTRDKKIVALLRQEHLLRIVLIIMKRPTIQHKNLSRLLKIHPSTLTHHLNKLDECDIIDVITYGREKGYVINNKKEIIRIVRRYVIDIISDRFKDTWMDLNLRHL